MLYSQTIFCASPVEGEMLIDGKTKVLNPAFIFYHEILKMALINPVV